MVNDQTRDPDYEKTEKNLVEKISQRYDEIRETLLKI